MTLQLVPGANLWCVLHHFSSLTRWSGSRGQVWPKVTEKTKLKFKFLFLGMIATKIVARASNSFQKGSYIVGVPSGSGPC